LDASLDYSAVSGVREIISILALDVLIVKRSYGPLLFACIKSEIVESAEGTVPASDQFVAFGIGFSNAAKIEGFGRNDIAIEGAINSGNYGSVKECPNSKAIRVFNFPDDVKGTINFGGTLINWWSEEY